MKNRNKAATAATAAVLSAALLMTGTFAWNDFSQKKLNELAGVLNYDVALVEDFEETSDWSFANPDVNKDVSAANKGDNAAYVRINLREYLQVRPFTYTNDSYVKDAEGNPVRFAVDKNGEYIPSTAADPKAFGVDFGGDIGDKYFVVAQGADQTIATMDSTNENGQIGKFMINPALPDGGKVYDADKVEHYGAAKKAATTDEEMAYAIHKFTDTPDPWQTKVEEYVSWKMGPAVKTMAEYKALTADVKKDAKFWITDTDGWCYWSQPLAKDEQTTLLLDAATLKKSPRGDLYYAIHSTMQAVDKENLGYWAADATEDAKDTILPDLNDGETVTPKIPATDVTLDQTTLIRSDGEPVKLTATVEPAEASQEVKWTSSNKKVAIVDKDGNVTAVGQGTATITATTTDGSNKKATCTVSVPTWVSSTGLKISRSTMEINGYSTQGVSILSVTHTPSNVSNPHCIWTSSDETVVKIAKEEVIKGTTRSDVYLTTVGVGTAILTATTMDGQYSAQCTVTVKPVAATGVLSDGNLYAASGTVVDMPTISFYPGANVTDPISYTSSDPSVFSINQADKTLNIVGAADTSATLTISVGSYSTTCKISVAGEIMTMGINPRTNEPLDWIVLEKQDGKALLLASTYVGSTKYGGNTWISWDAPSNSTAQYLNNTDIGTSFINTAFTDEERARILDTTIKTRANQNFTDDLMDVTTKLFLFSANENESYCYQDYVSFAPAIDKPEWFSSMRGTGWQQTDTITKNGYLSTSSGLNEARVRPLMWVTLP